MTPERQSPRQRVTLADVAKRAGVSPALVSIVMRDAPGASESSRLRIQAAARELGYRPDVRARALASLKSHMVGVVFGVANSYHFELIDGLYLAAEERGWDLVLSALTASRDEKRALDSLQDFRFDALVMLGPPVTSPTLAGEVPLVVIGWHVDHPDVDVVRTSDEQGIRLAVDHLVELGHRRIGHVQGGDGLIARSRRDAYLLAMNAHGLAHEVELVECDGEDQLDGQRAMSAFLDSGAALPTGIVAFNDNLAAAAMTVLMQHGLSVPRDVSVVGFDNSALAHSPGILLTSVTQEPRTLGRLAVERIIERSAGIPVENREIVLTPELAVRASTGPVPAAR
ncbi:putative LacI family transcriptional regulator [metagenome]|uniref:Putative LacI family transcriptional regulator n=1 Tax=metagenome TaxID=256318 RepID=A0A2P2C6Y6_9ZZZZ